MRYELSQAAAKSFEIKGYERMIERMMVGPLLEKPELEEQFLTI